MAQATVGSFYVSPNAITTGIHTHATANVYSSKEAFVYISKNTLVAGLDNLHFTATTKTKNTTFYVKEKTVFYPEKNSHVQVVYISSIKEVAINEKVLTTFKKPPLLLKQKKQTVLQVNPIHKLPFRVGVFNFFGNNVAIVINNITQNAKVNTTFKYKVPYVICYAVSTLNNKSINNKSITNNFSYKTLKYTTNILKTNFGRPPPFV